jgi:hypothetical protein
MSLVPMNVCFRADCVAKLGGHLLIGLVGKFDWPFFRAPDEGVAAATHQH